MSPTARTCGTSPITATSSAPTAPWGAGSGSASTPTARWPGGRPGSSGPTARASAPPITGMPVPPENGLVSESHGRRTSRDRTPSPAARGVPPGRPRPGPHHRPARGRLRPRRADRLPAQLDLDLTWTTDGVPYHYDLTTRYEIPCLVSGTVTVDGETFSGRRAGPARPLLGRAGLVGLWMVLVLPAPRRRHPGPPGRHPHERRRPRLLRIHPEARPGLSRHCALGDRGPRRPRIPLQGAHRDRRRPRPGPELDLGIEVTPVSFGPVLLRNDDGRVSRFPRALVRCRTDDGREGAGWIEWNQPT